MLGTTTLAIPIVATTSTSTVFKGGEATRTVVLDYLNIQTKENTALLNWQTNTPSRYALRWGRTDAYTGGYVLNEIYQLEHETTITDLEPGTTYLYELIGYTPAGFALVLKKGQFTTKQIPEEKPVANVTKLEVEVIGSDVLLNFALPQGEDIALVRIVRSHLGFPLDSNDGAIIYEGTALNWRDEAALSLYTTQYYSVFAVSSNGAFSSGAVARASRDNLEDPGTEENASSTASSSPVVVPEIPLFGFEVSAIKIRQLQKDFGFLEENIELSYKDSFAISIPITALPKHLKSIVVTLFDPTDQRKSYSFLLRINRDQTAYEATIAPLYVRGVSRLQIEIFDYERMLVGRYRKGISFVVKADENPAVVFPDAIVLSLRNILPTISAGAFLLGLLALLLWRRSRKAEDNR
jgi:hypothetical protein